MLTLNPSRYHEVALGSVCDYRWRMPSYAADPSLQLAANLYLNEEHQGVVKRAATALKLDYIMFRRFLATGRAKPENRQKIRDALDTADRRVAKDHKISHNLPIDVTRSMLTQLLEALDVYQAAGLIPRTPS